MWFDNWEHDLVELGFAVHDPTTGKIHIQEDQLGLIGNFDKHASISTAAAPIMEVVLRHSFKTQDF
jgi:DNA-binding IclR family transcriptional regulator